jgi:hypothetical protein
MTPKKRLTRKDPGYFIPLPYAMAVKKVYNDLGIERRLFKGMQLDLQKEGLINVQISIQASINGERVVLGYIPKGMVSRVEGLMEHDEKVVVTLERIQCDRLKNSFWVCFDQLPDLPPLSW